MNERRDHDIATTERSNPATGQPTNRPLSTSDLAATDRPVQPNEPARPPAPDQESPPRAVPPRVVPADGHNVDEKAAPLFESSRAQEYRGRWDTIQTGFVDEPRRAVEQADALVAEVIQQLTRSFADARSKLEQQRSRGDNISTEDFRLALRRYRSFYDRLLTM
jgi:hypothetical protein